MKIGFDAKRAVSNNTGLGNYSRLIIDLLSEYYPDNEYRLYVPKMRENVRLTPLLDRKSVAIATPGTRWGKRLSGLWRVGGGIVDDVERDGVELFHGLSNELPLPIRSAGIPTVVTIHDLIFLRYPEYYKPIDRKIYDYKFRKACEHATRVIAITECTKRDIMSYYGTPEEKIDVVYQGCHRSFSAPVSGERLSEVRSLYGLPDRFVLYVGTIEDRKNLLLAVKAMEGIDAGIHLVAVGRCTAYGERVKAYAVAHGLGKRVHFYDRIAFEHLPALYHLARVMAYPSRFEGFGIPILESLSCGTPVVACTGSCLEEAGGAGAIYVNPDDVDGMRSALLSLLTDEDLRRELIAGGMEHVAKFQPEEIARNVMNVYKRAIGNG